MRTTALLALLILSGCYETGYEARKREDIEQRIRDLERRQCTLPEWSCKGGCCP